MEQRRHIFGVSLIEALIAAAMMMLAMSSVYALVRAATTFQKAYDLSTEVQSEALFGMSRVNKEFSETSLGSIKISPDLTGAVFVSPRSDVEGSTIEYTTVGQIYWQSIVCIYLDGHTVLRKRMPIDPKTTAVPTTLPSVAEFRSLSLPSAVLARSVDLFEMDIKNRRVSVKIATRRSYADRDFRVELLGGTGPRN